MDLKCFDCIREQWSAGTKPTALQGFSYYETAAERARGAVTIVGGTALCADHAVKEGLAEPEAPRVPRRIR